MYTKIYTIKENIIRVNIDYIRKLLEDPNVNSDDVLDSFVNLNLETISKTPKLLIFIIDYSSVTIKDIQYVGFVIQLLLAVQIRFKDNVKEIRVFNSSPIIENVLNTTSHLINVDCMNKIKFK